jgi:hypothetical protein
MYMLVSRLVVGTAFLLVVSIRLFFTIFNLKLWILRPLRIAPGLVFENRCQVPSLADGSQRDIAS